MRLTGSVQPTKPSDPDGAVTVSRSGGLSYARSIRKAGLARAGFRRFPVLRRRTVRYLAAIAISLLVSCGTTRTGTAPGRNSGSPEPPRGRIERLFAEGSFARALELIQFERAGLDRAGGPQTLETAALGTLAGEAVRGLSLEFERSVLNERYRQSLAAYRSLARSVEHGTIPPDTLTDTYRIWSEPKLLAAEANRLLEEGLRPAALQTFAEALERDTGGTLGEPELRALGTAALGSGDLVLVKRAIEALELSGAAVPQELLAAFEPVSGGSASGTTAPVGPAGTTRTFPDTGGRYLDGTVTVYVNKGIRIERGVGYPDRAVGSGFFIDTSGYIVTNYHVIASEVDPKYEGYSRLFVIPSGSKDRIPARVIGYDPVFDVALLKTELDAPKLFTFSRDETLSPGDSIRAVGSPAGLENTVTSGIVSAVERRFLQLGDVVQIDVPVNPGNSGGPLLDRDGALAGIVYAGLEPYEGLNFAIPASWVARILPRLYSGGKAVHPWLGAAVHESASGLEVMYTVPGSTAERIALSAGEFVTAVNGVPVRRIREAQRALLEQDPGTLVRLTVRNSGGERELLAALDARPDIPLESALEKDLPENVFPALYGISVRKVDGFLWERSYVVEKVYAGTTADESGISAGDPFAVKSFEVDTETRAAYLRMYMKKRKAGFLETAIQVGAFLETDNFL